MTEIDLTGKSDHDLLVITVTTLNMMDERLLTVCHQVDKHNIQLTKLQTEHDERKNQADCTMPPPTSRKKLITSGGIGGAIGTIIAGVILAIWEYFQRK
jgi:hypothetical protein